MKQQQGINRRDFLRIVGASSVAGLAAVVVGRNDKRASEPETVSETRLLMGTVVNLTLVTADQKAGEKAIQACFDQMAQLETIMSRHQPDSQLSRLNRDGYLAQADPSLVRVLEEAFTISDLTGGAFDVTIKPLVDLYESFQKAGRGLPDDKLIDQTRERVGYQQVTRGSAEVAFSKPGMALTLDGIAKGYIVDEGISILRQYGFENILVEAGGDLSASGAKPGNTPWKIGIQWPRQDSQRRLNAFQVSNQAVATSGDYMQAYSDDLTAHHILDPRTGHSAPDLASATIVTASGMVADALATAVMVLGPDEGLALIESVDACEGVLVTKDLQVLRSSGMPAV